jgi:hypothetical protein
MMLVTTARFGAIVEGTFWASHFRQLKIARKDKWERLQDTVEFGAGTPRMFHEPIIHSSGIMNL